MIDGITAIKCTEYPDQLMMKICKNPYSGKKSKGLIEKLKSLVMDVDRHIKNK